jgi:hypothetical protein
VKSEPVLLVANLNAGTAGWCVTIGGDGNCPTAASGTPIVMQSWVVSEPPPVAVGYAITNGQTVAVSIGGQAIATHRERGLPDGLRAVVVEVRAQGASNTEHRAPRFTALNTKGEAIEESRRGGPPLALIGLPSRVVADPMHPASGICRLEAGLIDGLTTGGGEVITTATPHPAAVGQGVMACASTSYELDGWPLLASVLLSASHPGMAPPTLPGMRPIQGHPGSFEAPGFEGAILARRIPGAWLAVAKGQGLQQRLSLLAHLHATVSV